MAEGSAVRELTKRRGQFCRFVRLDALEAGCEQARQDPDLRSELDDWVLPHPAVELKLVLARVRDRERRDQADRLEQPPTTLAPVRDQPVVSPVSDLPLRHPRQLGDVAAAQRVAMPDSGAWIKNMPLIEEQSARPLYRTSLLAEHVGVMDSPMYRYHRRNCPRSRP